MEFLVETIFVIIVLGMCLSIFLAGKGLDLEDLFYVLRNLYLRLTRKGHFERVVLDEEDSIDQLVLVLPHGDIERCPIFYHNFRPKLPLSAKALTISKRKFSGYSDVFVDGAYIYRYTFESLVAQLRASLFYITSTYPEKKDPSNMRAVIKSYLIEEDTQHTLATAINLLKQPLPEGVALSDSDIDSSDEMEDLKKNISNITHELYTRIEAHEDRVEDLKQQERRNEIDSFNSEIKHLASTKLDIKSVLGQKD